MYIAGSYRRIQFSKALRVVKNIDHTLEPFHVFEPVRFAAAAGLIELMKKIRAKSSDSNENFTSDGNRRSIMALYFSIMQGHARCGLLVPTINGIVVDIYNHPLHQNIHRLCSQYMGCVFILAMCRLAFRNKETLLPLTQQCCC